jgi:hypothetical protein
MIVSGNVQSSSWSPRLGTCQIQPGSGRTRNAAAPNPTSTHGQTSAR